jgi:hypothetical protein
MVETGMAPDALRRRVVLLGASNLTRGISTVIETARAHLGRPLDVLAAHGHGRSYGTTSCVLGRRLPGIAECGLWHQLKARSPLPVSALVTDIGNDLAYGIDVSRIVAWVETCLDRLAAVGAETIMTSLPLTTLVRIRPAGFYLLRTLFFPFNRQSLSELVGLAHELDERIRKVAAERSLPIVVPQSAWYGFDPIHIRLHCGSKAWHTILSHWQLDCLDAGRERVGNPPARHARRSFARWWRLKTTMPQQQHFCGFRLRRAQPTARWHDGTTISFF